MGDFRSLSCVLFIYPFCLFFSPSLIMRATLFFHTTQLFFFLFSLLKICTPSNTNTHKKSLPLVRFYTHSTLPLYIFQLQRSFDYPLCLVLFLSFFLLSVFSLLFLFFWAIGLSLSFVVLFVNRLFMPHPLIKSVYPNFICNKRKK